MRIFTPPPPPKHRNYIGNWPDRSICSLEIGCGDGNHAFNFASCYSDKFLLGFERTHQKFKRAELKFNKLTIKPHNFCLIHGNSENWLSHDFKDFHFETIFLLYPNPYPKSSQSHLRWHNSSFMQHLLGRLLIGGHLILRTNLDWYMQEAKAQYGVRNALKEIHCVKVAESEPITSFEIKYLARNESCFELRLQKLG